MLWSFDWRSCRVCIEQQSKVVQGQLHTLTTVMSGCSSSRLAMPRQAVVKLCKGLAWTVDANMQHIAGDDNTLVLRQKDKICRRNV